MKLEYYTPTLDECVAIEWRCGGKKSAATIAQEMAQGLWRYLTAKSLRELREQTPFIRIPQND